MFTGWWDSLSLFSQVLCCIAAPATLILLVQTVLMLIGIGSHGDTDTDGDAGVDGHDGFDTHDGVDTHDGFGDHGDFVHDGFGDHGDFAHDGFGDHGDFSHDGFDGHGDFAHDGAELDTDASDGDIYTDGSGVYGDNSVQGDRDPSGMGGLRIISFRTLVSFFAVFGWVGVVLDSAGMDRVLSLFIAFAAGLAVMLLIAFLMRAAMKLQSDGTIDIRSALGQSGTVYLTVPPKRSGAGKVNVTVQGQYSEFNAVTDEETALPTGSEALVIGISGKSTLVVRRK